jgi:TRAP-type C4-dicarboxylate transport system permease small subunit
MTDDGETTPVEGFSRPAEGFGRILNQLAAAFAVAGGLLLVLTTLLVVTSITGRALFLRPVPGDFEIVGIATAISIFLFLPYCYLQGGHVTVDIFVKQMAPRVQRAMDVVAALVFGFITALFTWRMSLGLADTFRYQDLSMIVGAPLWWAYPFAVASFGLMTLSAAYGVYTCLEAPERPGDE